MSDVWKKDSSMSGTVPHRLLCWWKACAAIAASAALAATLSILFLDRFLLQLLAAHGSPALIRTAHDVAVFMLPLALAAFLVRIHQHTGASRRTKAGTNQIYLCAAALVLAILAVEALKLLAGRIGPETFLASGVFGFRLLAGDLASASFPSEYGAGIGVFAPALWMLLPEYRPTVALLIVLSAASQVIIRAAFPSDVVAGIAIGFAALLVSERLFERSGRPILRECRITGRRDRR